MKLLRDDEIQALVTQAQPLLKNFKAPKEWHAADSLVQPSSLDLHVGDIILPGVRSGQPGSVQKPRKSYALATGETAVVVTQETISMPSNVAGFGFPPTRISNRAVLMTNPGHIDPGYSGQLRFTLINMGREPCEIRQGEVVVTLLLVELSKAATCDYGQRNPNAASSAGLEEDVQRLGKDFLEVTNRAKAIATKAVVAAGIGVPLLAALVSLLVALLQPNWKDPVNDLKTKVEVLSSERNAGAVERRVDRIEKVLRIRPDTQSAHGRD